MKDKQLKTKNKDDQLLFFMEEYNLDAKDLHELVDKYSVMREALTCSFEKSNPRW